MKRTTLAALAGSVLLLCAQARGDGDPFTEAEDRLAKGRFEDALAAAGRAVAIDPEDGRGHLLKGRALEGLSRFDQAAAAYQDAMMRLPFDSDISMDAHDGYVRSLVGRSRTDEDRGDLPMALDSVENALVMDSENVSIMLHRALILDKLGRQDDAFEQCESALGIDPSDAQALRLAASLRLRAGDMESAEKFLTALCTRSTQASNADLSQARTDLGAMSLERGDRGLAFEHFSAAVALDPGNERARGAALELAAFREQAIKAAAAEKTLLVGCAAAVAAWVALIAVLRIRYF